MFICTSQKILLSMTSQVLGYNKRLHRSVQQSIFDKK